MAMGSQQLAEDYTQLKELLELYPNITLLQADGEPPDNYEVEYSLRGFVRNGDNEVSIGSNHRVRISLPFGYPHFAPIAKPLTSIFHPDFDPAAIRIADQWQKNPSLPELVLHIGEMISGNVYQVDDPFNQEAAEWYKSHTDQLPLDSLNLADIQETDTQHDSLVDDTFASLCLENNDFLAPEKAFDPAEIDYIRQLVSQNQFFTANKLLVDLPENVPFPDREEIQQSIGKVLRKTDKLFKLAEQLEDMAKFDEALQVTDNLLAIASDAPGAAALRSRIQQSCQLAQTLPQSERPDPSADRQAPQPSAPPSPPPPPPSKRALPSLRFSSNMPFKPILIGVVTLGIGAGALTLYFKDQNALSQSQAHLLNGQVLLEKQQFDAALNSLESAEQALDDLTLLRFRNATYEKPIAALINSRQLQEGLKGRVLYEGEYIASAAAAALHELNILTEQGQTLAGQNKITEALALYRQALQLAEKHKLVKQQEPIREILQSLELQQTLSTAEQAEQGKNWDQAAEAYRKALSLSANIKNLGTASEITHRLTAASFRRDLDQSKKAFTQSQWQETIRILEQAQQNIINNPTAVTEKERLDLHKLLVNARLYLMLTTAREAYEVKQWDLAIREYQNALDLLHNDPESAKELVGESVDKIERTLLLVHIAQLQEKTLIAQSSNDSAEIIRHGHAMQRLIQGSKFANDPAIKNISQKVVANINTHQEALSQGEKIRWLEEHYEEIFRNNYPTFRGSKLSQPKAVFDKKVSNKSYFNLTCTERSQGSAAKLELSYAYDHDTGKWSVPKE